MDANMMIETISTVGFPIACVIGLAIFMFQNFKGIMERNVKREDKLYETLDANQTQLNNLISTNAKYLEVLEELKTDLKELKDDVKYAHVRYEEHHKKGDE